MLLFFFPVRYILDHLSTYWKKRKHLCGQKNGRNLCMRLIKTRTIVMPNLETLIYDDLYPLNLILVSVRIRCNEGPVLYSNSGDVRISRPSERRN